MNLKFSKNSFLIKTFLSVLRCCQLDCGPFFFYYICFPVFFIDPFQESDLFSLVSNDLSALFHRSLMDFYNFICNNFFYFKGNRHSEICKSAFFFNITAINFNIRIQFFSIYTVLLLKIRHKICHHFNL